MRVATALLLCLSASRSPAADPWAQYGGPAGDFRLPAAKAAAGGAEWKRTFGPGTCGVVADGTRLYTMYAVPRDAKAGDEVTVALDPATGKTQWEERVAVTLRPKQETFGGAPVQPQATPVVADGRLFTVGFTGRLCARDAATGKALWSADLVADHAATPVQFGFAASPIVRAGKLIVHVGGKHAVIAFDPGTGKALWKSAAAEPGYATPVVMTWDKRAVIVQLTRDALFGFDAATGATLWTYALPKKGLTNVPTPIPLDDGRLLVSGQGLDGTRLLQLVRSGDSAEVRELWHQRKAQFFYTNWACDGEAVYGFTGNGGKRLTALRVKDGSVVFQELGQTDANVICLGRELLVCRGDGLVSLGSATADGFAATARGQPVAGRCWAPPTVLGNAVVVRSGAELAAVRLSSLAADFKPPADAGVSALDAAFGGPRPEPKSPDR